MRLANQDGFIPQPEPTCSLDDMAQDAFEQDDCECVEPLLDISQTASSGTAAMRIDGQTLRRFLGSG